jgi:hypothetical protein
MQYQFYQSVKNSTVITANSEMASQFDIKIDNPNELLNITYFFSENAHNFKPVEFNFIQGLYFFRFDDLRYMVVDISNKATHKLKHLKTLLLYRFIFILPEDDLIKEFVDFCDENEEFMSYVENEIKVNPDTMFKPEDFNDEQIGIIQKRLYLEERLKPKVVIFDRVKPDLLAYVNPILVEAIPEREDLYKNQVNIMWNHLETKVEPQYAMDMPLEVLEQICNQIIINGDESVSVEVRK